MKRYAYTVTIPRKSLATLEWLAARGYDANFLALANRTDDDDNGLVITFGLTEPEAWVFATNAVSDTSVSVADNAFLTCSADTALNEALRGLLERIV